MTDRLGAGQAGPSDPEALARETQKYELCRQHNAGPTCCYFCVLAALRASEAALATMTASRDVCLQALEEQDAKLATMTKEREEQGLMKAQLAKRVETLELRILKARAEATKVEEDCVCKGSLDDLDAGVPEQPERDPSLTEEQNVWLLFMHEAAIRAPQPPEPECSCLTGGHDAHVLGCPSSPSPPREEPSE